MISPTEQALAKLICLVVGLGMLYGFIVMVGVSWYSMMKGENK